MTSSNAYIVFEQADAALAIEQLPQFAQRGEKILHDMVAVVDQMMTVNQQPLSTHQTITGQNSETLTTLQSLMQQLKEVFTQLPDITQKLHRARALFIDQQVSQTTNLEQSLDNVQYLKHPTETGQEEELPTDDRTDAPCSAPVISPEEKPVDQVRPFQDIIGHKHHDLALGQINQALETQVQERTYALQKGIQELKETQTQLVQSEKMATLGNLVSGIAHEINNPVGFIAGNIKPAIAYTESLFGLLDLYQTHNPNPHPAITLEIEEIDLEYIREDLPKLIGSIQSGAQRIKDISTSLRTFSRADTDTPVEFDIHDGIDSTLLILKHRLKANDLRSGIEIVKQYGQLPPIECYAGQLNQVFMNLLANAIDAIDESNPTDARIEIQTALLKKASKQHVQITIKDNGIGMSEEVQQHIFEHLFTTKSVGKGTGLGLAIARQIILGTHQGSITVNSSLETGTAFMTTLPVKAPMNKN